jgi:hypothetical protein
MCVTHNACPTTGCLYARRDQLILVDMASGKKEELGKGIKEEKN